MTWLDITLLVIWTLFLALGARMGSLWTGACVMGGFFGAYLADTFALPASDMIGGFAGSAGLAGLVLFLVGLAVFLIPGWLVSRMGKLLFLGLLDSLFGMITGALVGLVALALVLLFVVPMFPQIEKQKAWKNSVVIKPFQEVMEDIFNNRRFRPWSITKRIKADAINKITPATKKAVKDIKKTATDFVDDIR